MDTSSTTSRNHNKIVTDILQEMQDVYEASDVEDEHQWKSLAYRKAITALRGLPHRIRLNERGGVREEDLRVKGRRVFGVGDSMVDHIREILKTGRFGKLESRKRTPRSRAMQELVLVHGIGNVMAARLFEGGITSLEDLRKRSAEDPTVLTAAQKIGLRHVEEFQKRMPRQEAAEIISVVSKRADRVASEMGYRGTRDVMACGSFRRLQSTCGDVDILLKCDDTRTIQPMLIALVSSLERDGFITDALQGRHRDISTLGPSEGTKHASWMGVCRLPSDPSATQKRLHRRIDIKIYHSSVFAFAMLYFTGDAYYNRSLRAYATKVHHAFV